MVINRSPFEVTCQSLTVALNGKLTLGEIPPLHREDTLINRISLDSNSIRMGDTYLHCASLNSLLSDAAEAYEHGANGIVCVSPLPPLAGGFTITIPSLESIHGSQYSLISNLLSGGSLLEHTEHLHHLRRSA